MTWILALGFLGTISAIGLVWWGVVEGSNALISALQRDPDHDLRARVLEIEDAVDRLPAKWEEVQATIRRSEERTRATVIRARKELEELGYTHPGVEAEAAELQLFNGAGGEDPGLQRVRAGMEGHAPAPETPAPDWRAATLAKKYGR